MIPCKYFYDAHGAALFQNICELPEYYVTRTEIDILDRSRADIASQLGPNIELIGLGTGAGTKTRILIEALENPAVYPRRYLRKTTAQVGCSFPKNFSGPGNSTGMRGLPATCGVAFTQSQSCPKHCVLPGIDYRQLRA